MNLNERNERKRNYLKIEGKTDKKKQMKFFFFKLKEIIKGSKNIAKN